VIIAPTPNGEVESFDSTVEGLWNVGFGPQLVTMTGPVQIIAYDKHTTEGSWQTEILSMDLSGDVGGVSIEIRESPVKASPGKVRVKDIGGGLFQIDSFFDVFVELSVDGGPFQPQTNEASRMELMPVPEPGRLLMLLVGVPFVLWLAGRKQRKRR
jgi:hypothetical protein